MLPFPQGQKLPSLSFIWSVSIKWRGKFTWLNRHSSLLGGHIFRLRNMFFWTRLNCAIYKFTPPPPPKKKNQKKMPTSIRQGNRICSVQKQVWSFLFRGENKQLLFSWEKGNSLYLFFWERKMETQRNKFIFEWTTPGADKATGTRRSFKQSSSKYFRYGCELSGAFHLGKEPGNFGGSKSGISDW